MPAFVDPALYADFLKPAPPAPPPTREQQLERALDAVLLPMLESVLDRNALDELCASSPLAAEKLIAFAIRDLEWRRDQLRPKGAAQ